MEHLNLNKEALDFLEQTCATEINLTLSSKEIFTQTYKFFGDIAAFNRIGILYRGGNNINTFFDPLSPELDQRLTVWITNLVCEFIIHMESMRTGSWKELYTLVRSSVELTLASGAVPKDIAGRIEIELLDDPLYLTFYMLQPALKRLIVESNRMVGARINETTETNHIN